MIDRLRMWLNRPLVDASRRTLFLAAVAVILIAATALALLSSPQSTSTGATTTATATSAQRPPAAAAQSGESLVRPSEEGHATGLVGKTRQIEAAKRAARSFLAGYLPYTYGQRKAADVPAATSGLRQQLEAHAPRVPPSERHRHARVVVLQANGAGPVRAAMIALVDDGAHRYTVSLELERRRTGWQVTNVGA